MIRPHHVHIYQRFREGNGYLARFQAFQYRHKKTAMGGDDSASCVVIATPAEAERILTDYLGCTVQTYVDNPIVPVWEGFISRITLEIGGVVFSRSLESMSNRVNVTYYNSDSAAADKTEQTAKVNNGLSQAKYGIKEGSYDAGVHYDNSDKTHKTALGSMVLGVYSWPQYSTEVRTPGAVVVRLEMQGFYHVWEWENYRNTGTTKYGAGGMLRRLLAFADANAPSNASYIYDTRLVGDPPPLMGTNAAFNISEESKTGQTYWQFAQGIVEAGDGVSAWVLQITRPDPNTGLRQVYYQPANTAVAYVMRPLTEPNVIRTPYGTRVNGWDVEPDRAVEFTDVLSFDKLEGDNPKKAYISAVEYDADAQSVSIQSGDDLTLEAALGFRRYIKRIGDRFGAQLRQTV